MDYVGRVRPAQLQGGYKEWRGYLQDHFNDMMRYSSGQLAYMGYLRTKYLQSIDLQEKVVTHNVPMGIVFNAFVEFFDHMAEYEQEIRWGSEVNERGKLNTRFAAGDVAAIVDSIRVPKAADEEGDEEGDEDDVEWDDDEFAFSLNGNGDGDS